MGLQEQNMSTTFTVTLQTATTFHCASSYSELLRLRSLWGGCGLLVPNTTVRIAVLQTKKPLKWEEHEQIEASTETASVGREPLHDEMSLVPGTGLGSISDTWRGDEGLAGLSYNNSSLGPGTTELGSGMWAVLEGGVALRNPRHRDPLAMQWMQNCHQLMKFHSTLYLNRFE